MDAALDLSRKRVDVCVVDEAARCGVAARRRLRDPQDHGSFEDVTQHPQLRDVLAEPFPLGGFIEGEALGVTPLERVLASQFPACPAPW